MNHIKHVGEKEKPAFARLKSRAKISLLALALVVLSSSSASSQALFGYTPSEIKSKHPDLEFSYDRWGNNNSKLLMKWVGEDMTVIYFFDKENLSQSTAIAPHGQGILQAMIERYNNRYVIVDDTHWKFYSEGVVYLVTLDTLEDGTYFFMWTMLP